MTGETALLRLAKAVVLGCDVLLGGVPRVGPMRLMQLLGSGNGDADDLLVAALQKCANSKSI